MLNIFRKLSLQEAVNDKVHKPIQSIVPKWFPFRIAQNMYIHL